MNISFNTNEVTGKLKGFYTKNKSTIKTVGGALVFFLAGVFVGSVNKPVKTVKTITLPDGTTIYKF